jgi:hypothetical protein
MVGCRTIYILLIECFLGFPALGNTGICHSWLAGFGLSVFHVLILFALHDSSYTYLLHYKCRFSSLTFQGSYHLRRDMVANSFGNARGSGEVRKVRLRRTPGWVKTVWKTDAVQTQAANLNQSFLFLPLALNLPLIQ